ncbi:Monooxygenase, FAD-binding [Penicillium expansum]|uniref:Monooxygenase, FAD-binding n=1 Tax=Penicillium expansum TaxID=27334 RepID=A0A0A2IIV0_PENEN|nr:Monooxygenase, FAD-binding [Penicillium expansum]KGO42358.1 Monooxygenase, FAD-binding [Penicillium expansum]KGO56400.1 Monooxygenase, FAD-binding [Penicillium expansum]
MALKVLICGGGVAGPALAYWLARIGHEVVVVERFPALRATGAQIDLRGQGIEAVKRMGLIDAVRGKLVDEAGVSFIDAKGNVKATILANKSGKGAQSLTSEYEIMRGDLVRIFYEATKDNVKYIFGRTVDGFMENDQGVVAYFSDGSSDTFDLLVGADGQGSHIRRNILPPGAPDAYHQLGIHMAYWFVPSVESDNNMCKSYICPGGRLIMTRSHNKTETQVYFMLTSDSEELRNIPKGSVGQQKHFWAEKFRDAGWQADRFIKGMDTTENWFCQNAVQIKTDTWHSGRVVLLGDAAHCPSPLTGMGTSTSLAGAYVLAGELARSEDLSHAFQKYSQIMRPFIDEVQQFNIGWIRLAVPKSQWAISLVHLIIGVACFLRIPQLISRFSGEGDGDWKLPDYPELNVEHIDL